METITNAFLTYAVSILGETERGLSGPRILEVTSSYAVDFGKDLPFTKYPFPTSVPNKRTALLKNLSVFSSKEQYQIIKDMCENDFFKNNEAAQELKMKLIRSYPKLGIESESELNNAIVEEVRHWLEDYEECLDLYNEALSKMNTNLFQRNILDDLRLALEKLVCSLLGNNKSLENQIKLIGQFVQDRNCSKEFVNMFMKLVDYYTKYQNTYVKHDNAVIEDEVEMIFEMTSVFMKFLVKIK